MSDRVEVRHTISLEQFRKLVNGEIVKLVDKDFVLVEVALEDCGFSLMSRAIADARLKAGAPKVGGTSVEFKS